MRRILIAASAFTALVPGNIAVAQENSSAEESGPSVAAYSSSVILVLVAGIVIATVADGSDQSRAQPVSP